MPLHAPIYYVKVLKFDGTAFTYTAPDGTVITPSMPLPVASVEFTDTLFIPGQSQPGSFALTLHNTKAPEYRYLRPLYNALMFEQRVEIYANETLKGKPVFAGDITEFADELGARQVRGEDARHRLSTQNLHKYQSLSANGAALIQQLLSTYQISFKDDFNRTTGLGADWTADEGTWDIKDNEALWATAPGIGLVNPRIARTAAHPVAFWNDGARVSFDWYPAGVASAGVMGLPVWLTNAGHTLYTGFEVQMSAINAIIGITNAGVSITYREMNTLDVAIQHWDLQYVKVATGMQLSAYLNDIEIITAVNPDIPITDCHIELMSPVVGGVVIGDYWDNYIECELSPALTPGTIDATAETITREANGESQLATIEFVCEQLGWEYRFNYEAGEGNDTFDAGTGIGADYSADVVLEDGVNIERLQMSRAVSDLATWLRVYGQSQDETRTSIIVTDLSAMDNFGIVMGDCSDQSIVDASTARIVGISRLTQTAAGGVSISGRIKDEWLLYAQSPIWGSAVWGDFIWGGRPRWRPGDYVWLKWEDRAVNRQVRIVSVTRKSGDIGLDLTFDYFAWTRAQILERQQIAFARAYRAWIDRNNSPHLEFVSTGAGTVTIYFTLVGGILTGVRLDAKVRSGAGNVTAILLDAVDITAAVGGFPEAGDFSLDLSSYIRYSKAYSLGFTFAGAKTLDVDLHARVLS